MTGQSRLTIAIVLTATFVAGFVMGVTVIPDLVASWSTGLDEAAHRPTAATAHVAIRRS